jgi:Amt family ammonium transporter
MGRLLLTLFAMLTLAVGAASAADDASPAPAPAPAPAAAAAAPADAAAPAAAAPAAPAADKPKTIEERLAAVEAQSKAASDSVTEATLNTGDNAWVLVSTALVLLMTLPGLALFYGGLVRRKNVLGTMMQSLTIACLVSIIWAIVGYSIAFGPGSTHDKHDDKGAVVKDGSGNPVPEGDTSASFWGGMSYACLDQVITDKTHKLPVVQPDGSLKPLDNNPPLVPHEHGAYCASINHGAYMLFQLMFAIITPALICGAYAERMKFTAMAIFSSLWLVFVYCPLAHMVWGENGLFNWATPNPYTSAAFDFAGGTVVHISSGVAALMCAIFLGKRKGYPASPMPPHNLVLSFIGAALLWVGWFGFNAGSALQANGLAVIAFANTHFATAAAALSWPLAEWILRGKPTVLGACSGAVAGLVAITPASGFVTPMSAIIIGLVAGALCMCTASYLKRALGYDDSLDAFGVHGIGGMWGAIATGLFLNIDVNPNIASCNSDLYAELVKGSHAVVMGQVKAVLMAIVLSAVGSSILLAIIKFTIGLRVTPEQESEGLDLSQHGEEGYNEAA